MQHAAVVAVGITLPLRPSIAVIPSVAEQHYHRPWWRTTMSCPATVFTHEYGHEILWPPTDSCTCARSGALFPRQISATWKRNHRVESLEDTFPYFPAKSFSAVLSPPSDDVSTHKTRGKPRTHSHCVLRAAGWLRCPRRHDDRPPTTTTTTSTMNHDP